MFMFLHVLILTVSIHLLYDTAITLNVSPQGGALFKFSYWLSYGLSYMVVSTSSQHLLSKIEKSENCSRVNTENMPLLFKEVSSNKST